MSTEQSAVKVALVTGATSGIGRATARLLSARGYRVFGTSRNPPADRLDNFELLRLDVTSDASAAACVAEVVGRTGGRLDVLVNNVGTGILGACEESSAEQVKALFEVNVFGAVRMTNAALPHMRARRSGRVVVMSSSGGVASIPFAGYYCATKHALEAYTAALRAELMPLGIAASVVAPGPVSTPAGDNALRGDRPVAAYADRRDPAVAAFVKGIRNGMSPDRVAETILEVVEARDPHPRYVVGAQSWATSLLKRVLPNRVFQATARWATGG